MYSPVLTPTITPANPTAEREARLIESRGKSRVVAEPKPSVVAKANQDEEMLLVQLEIAAEQKDEKCFVITSETINWSRRPASDFIFAIDQALIAGAYAAARALATEGSARHPDSPELRNLAYLLAAPITGKKPRSLEHGIRQNRDWLKAHSTAYQGQWVALQQGTLLGFDASLRTLRQQINHNEGVLYTKIP